KSRTGAPVLRPTRTKATTRAARSRGSQARPQQNFEAYAHELEKKLEARERELSESLEQQTAASEVLRVISSSPGELEPVFQAMLANATRICEAKFATLYLCEGDGFRAVAMHNTPPAFAEARVRAGIIHPHPDTTMARAASTKRAAQIADATASQA